MTISEPVRTEEFIRDLNRLIAIITPSSPANSAGRAIKAPPREIILNERFASRKPSSHSHTELAAFFETVRADIVKTLGGTNWLKLIPAHDPLRCSIGLFETLDLGFRETAHTRMLAWLMDSGKEHGFDDILISAFLKRIFRLPARPCIWNVKIRSEAITSDKKGRLDIHMSGEWNAIGKASTRWEVILEAKIHADELDEQCSRYEAEARLVHAGERALVFLTPDGRAPATNSGKINQPWENLSFLDLLVVFRPELAALKDKPGFHMLRHYLAGVLKNLYQINCGENLSELEASNIYQISRYLSPVAKKGT